MKEVEINTKLIVEDDVAEMIEALISDGKLASDLQHYYTQLKMGAILLTNERLMDIVDNILDDIESGEFDDEEIVEETPQESVDAKTLEETMRKVLSEVLASNPLSFNMPIASSQEALTVSQQEDGDTTSEVGEVLVVDSGSSEDDFTEEELDEFADMFGF